MRARYFLTALLPIAGAGCGTPIDAPSLAPRSVERQPILSPDGGQETVGTVDSALAARLAPIVAAAEKSVASFARQRDLAEPIVSQTVDAREGSDRWLAGEQALSALQIALGPARDAATAIETLRLEPANATPANRNAVDAAAAKVAAIVDQQEAAVAALVALLAD